MAISMFLAFWGANLPALADWQASPLDGLIADADHVAVAKVVDVDAGAEAGSQIATLSLINALKGDPGSTFQLAGAERDPGLPRFQAGRTIVAFFDQAPGQPGVVLGRDQGAVPVVQQQSGPTGNLLQLALNRGSNLRLGEVLQFLPAGAPRVPTPLTAALLQQLEASATQQDTNAIRRLACRPDDYQRQAANTGIRLAGLLAIPQARACLERHATTPGSAYAIESVEALGNFADPRSLQALLSLIPPMEPKPFEEGTDKPEEDGPGPDFDPEDDGTPEPDPAEEADERPPIPPPEDAIDTGRDEPDQDVSEDDDANDGPLPPGPVVENDDAPFDPDDAFARPADGGLTEAAVLALGKLGETSAVSALSALTREGDNLGLHSTVVVALGLIATRPAQRELRAIANGHPNPLVRTLAQQTLQRVQG